MQVWSLRELVDVSSMNANDMTGAVLLPRRRAQQDERQVQLGSKSM